MAKHKVTIIGAGNVGATTAQRIFDKGYSDVVLIDILEGIPQGKSLDILESGPVLGSDSKIIGDNNYESSKNSDVVVANCAQKFHFVLNFPATRDNEAHYGCNIAVHHLESEAKKNDIKIGGLRAQNHVQVNCT